MYKILPKYFAYTSYICQNDTQRLILQFSSSPSRLFPLCLLAPLSSFSSPCTSSLLLVLLLLFFLLLIFLLYSLLSEVETHDLVKPSRIRQCMENAQG